MARKAACSFSTSRPLRCRVRRSTASSTRCASMPPRARRSSTSPIASTRCCARPSGSRPFATAATWAPSRRRNGQVEARLAHARALGRAGAAAGDARSRGGEPAAPSVRGLAGGYVAGASFEVGRHEILGIAGLIGSGAADVQRLLFGTSPDDVRRGHARRAALSSRGSARGHRGAGWPTCLPTGRARRSFRP